jgi:hypothetical protein
MIWLMRRMLVMWAMLSVICAGVVLIGRLNRAPDRLRMVGFELCDTGPCFRAIKAGTLWEEVKQHYPDTTADGHEILIVPVGYDGIDSIRFVASTGTPRKVMLMMIGGQAYNSQPFTAGEIVKRFGFPCRVVLLSRSDVLDLMIFAYPGTAFEIYVGNYDGKSEPRLEPKSPLRAFWFSSITCNSPIDRFTSHWRGFISSEVYEARNRRTLGVTP